METMFPTAALVGIAVGFAWALLDWFLLRPLIERPLRAGIAAAPVAERPRLEGRLGLMRALFGWQFLVFPLVGYLVGRFLPWGGVS